MKIVFMGTPDFAVPSLQMLIDDGHDVAAVYTQPDKPVGRKQVLTAPPVKLLAQSYGIPVYQPVKMRDGTVEAQLKEIAPQLIVVVAYGRLLPPSLLKIPQMGCINVHGSLLPKYRGAAPIQWAVINGDAETGVTTMFMAEGLDTGDILLTEKVKISEGETAGELFARLAPIGAECLQKTIADLSTITQKPQDNDNATLAPMLDKAMAQVDFTRSAEELVNLVRGLNPWPVAITDFGNKKLKIFTASAVEGSGEAGVVLDSENFVIACGKDALRLEKVQLEGSKPMEAKEFLRGKKIIVGKSLTAL